MTSLAAIASLCREIPITRIRFTGVYFLILDEEIIYIGQSTDVEMRIALHRAERSRPVKEYRGEVQPNPNYKDFERALWIEIPEHELNACEGALIRAISPRCNFGAPADIGRDAEVLQRFGMTPNVEARQDFESRRRARWPRGQASETQTIAVGQRLTATRSRQARRAQRLFAGIAAALVAS